MSKKSKITTVLVVVLLVVTIYLYAISVEQQIALSPKTDNSIQGVSDVDSGF